MSLSVADVSKTPLRLVVIVYCCQIQLLSFLVDLRVGSIHFIVQELESLGIKEPFFTLAFSLGFTVSLHQLIVKTIMSITLLGFLSLELLLKDINILVRIVVNSRPRSRSISYRNIESAVERSRMYSLIGIQCYV